MINQKMQKRSYKHIIGKFIRLLKPIHVVLVQGKQNKLMHFVDDQLLSDIFVKHHFKYHILYASNHSCSIDIQSIMKLQVTSITYMYADTIIADLMHRFK